MLWSELPDYSIGSKAICVRSSGMGVGAGERRIYRRIRATRARRSVVWQVLGDTIRLGWVIGRGEKVVTIPNRNN